MELQHWAHMHPLTEGDDSSSSCSCLLCGSEIQGGPSYYRCQVCGGFTVHKSCAELPQELLNHPWHPHHPLTLVFPRFPFLSPFQRFLSFTCDACGDRLFRRPFYYCSQCDFYLHVDCCQLPQHNTEHAGLHHHPLTLQLKHAYFSCDACGVTHGEQGPIYQCAPCRFWVHKGCVSLPTTIQYTPSHQHPLTLANSSHKSVLSRFQIFCHICKMPVKQKNCVYCCRGCQFYAHVRCATSEDVSPKSDREAEDQSPSQQICFPIPNEVSSNIVDLLLNHQFKQMTLGSSNSGTELKCLRDHPLTHSDSQTDELCDACVRPILGGPIYSCPECRLILHKSCGELPREIHFPLHTKHKIVLEHGRDFRCEACRRLSNGFAFYCGECSYTVDITCALLPTTIRHTTHHKHLLNLVDAYKDPCNACHEVWPKFKFKCINCNFILHIHCALLPPTVTHKFCKHELTLQYTAGRIRPEEYYCEICEVEVNPQIWFYYCADCNYAFHTKCLRDKYVNVKPGAIIKVDNHPHTLTLVRKPKFQPPFCGNYSGHKCGEVYFECKYCPFNLCYTCGMPGETSSKYVSSYVMEEAGDEIMKC